jgi:hypothetical protein
MEGLFMSDVSAQLVLPRRKFLIEATSMLLCAPAIVRAASLMPVRGLMMPINPPEPNPLSIKPQEGFVRCLLFASCDSDLEAGRTKSSFGFNGGRLSEKEMRDFVTYAKKWGFLT